MAEYCIRIELLSESIFATGEAEENSADIKALKDDLGFPYLKGKTFKGKLREEAETLKNYLVRYGDPSYEDIFNNLFGKPGEFNPNTLKFSDCRISEDIENYFRYMIDKNEITKEDLYNSLTEIRSFTKLDKEGVADEGSLRKARVIKRGLVLYCKIERMKELEPKEKAFLAGALAALRNLGAMESRGKGRVRCSLIENQMDSNEKYIEELMVGE